MQSSFPSGKHLSDQEIKLNPTQQQQQCIATQRSSTENETRIGITLSITTKRILRCVNVRKTEPCTKDETCVLQFTSSFNKCK